MSGATGDAVARFSRARLTQRRVPVVLVSGVNEAAMGSAALSLQLGLSGAVSLSHVIDATAQTLTRVVSDLAGTVERKVIDLEHACVSCAVREDIVPTLERLAAAGRWASIVACLPVTAEAVQVCRALAWAPHQASHVTIAAIVTALDGTTVADDLLGDDVLAERGLATGDDDQRGVAEVASAMVEYADVLCLTEAPHPDELGLLSVLARPRTPVLTDPSLLDASALVVGVHSHTRAEAWVSEVRRGPLPPLPPSGAWRLDLCSPRPFHPVRFQDCLEILGGGPRRSRGCFWLPTRPGDVCVWEAAGGQASVGATRTWDREQPLTRITVIGLDEDAAEVTAAFEQCLLTDDELAARGSIWDETWDGLEPWLGPIRHAA